MQVPDSVRSSSASQTATPIREGEGMAVPVNIIPSNQRMSSVLGASEASQLGASALSSQASSHFILETDALPPNELAMTGDAFSDFMLGHKSVTSNENGQLVEKFIDDFIDPKYFASDLLLDDAFVSLFFPLRQETASPFRAKTASRALFYSNPTLREVQLSLLDLFLIKFGLTREGKEIKPSQHFAQNAPWDWLNSQSQAGATQRNVLLRIIKSLNRLGNSDLAKNLCFEATKQLHLADPFMDLTDFDMAFTQGPVATLQKKPAPSASVEKAIFSSTEAEPQTIEIQSTEPEPALTIQEQEKLNKKQQIQKSLENFEQISLSDEAPISKEIFGIYDSKTIINQNISINLNAFEALTKDLDALQQQGLFVSDIKLENLRLTEAASDWSSLWQNISLAIPSDGILPLESSESDNLDIPFRLNQINHSLAYMPDKLRMALNLNQPLRASNEIRELLSRNNLYCLILSMYLMTEHQKPNIAQAINQTDPNFTKLNLNSWLAKVIKTEHLAQIWRFMQAPESAVINDGAAFSLHEIFEWDLAKRALNEATENQRQARLQEKVDLLSSEFSLNTDDLFDENFAPTGDSVADFMLGHYSILHNAGEPKYPLSHWIPSLQQPRTLPGSDLAAILFPEEQATNLPRVFSKATPETQDLFIDNPLLPRLHLQILDQVLPMFGLVRIEKEIKLAANFKEKSPFWLHPNYQVVAKELRNLLSQICRALFLLNNEEVATNLHRTGKLLLDQLLNPRQGQEFHELEHSLINVPRAPKAPPLAVSQSILNKLTPSSENAEQQNSKLQIKHELLIETAKESTRSERLKRSPDVIGNKEFYYIPSDNPELAYKVFYNQGVMVGLINFRDDLLPKEEQPQGKTKILTHRNDSTVYFKNKVALTQDQAPAAYLAHINKRNNTYFVNCPHIYPSYFINREDMVAKNAGELNGLEVINKKRRAPISAYKGLVEDINYCNDNNIYFTDICIENLVLKEKEQKPHFNLVDVDYDIVDTELDFNVPLNFDYPYMHPTIKTALPAPSFKSEAVGHEQILKKNNLYALLVSMFLIQTGKGKQSYDNTEESHALFLIDLSEWLSKVVHSEQLEKVINFIQDPLSVEIDLSETINWQYISDPSEYRIKPSEIKHFPREDELDTEVADFLCQQFEVTQEDRFGNKAIIYPETEGNEQTTYFFNQQTFLGKIHFSQNKEDALVKEGEYKKLTHANSSTLVFDTKIRPESPECLRTNSNNHYFDDCDYIIPAYFIDKQKMITRNVGNINGESAVNNGIMLPVSTFKGLLADLEKCHANNIYVSDIKPNNLIISQDKSTVSLIDIDTGVIDTSKKIILTSVNTTPKFIHLKTQQGILSQLRNPIPLQVNSLLRQNNYYGLLLSMFFMTANKTTSIEDYFDNAEFKQAFTAWLTKIIKPEATNLALDFIDDPVTTELPNLFNIINWDADFQQK